MNKLELSNTRYIFNLPSWPFWYKYLLWKYLQIFMPVRNIIINVSCLPFSKNEFIHFVWPLASSSLSNFNRKLQEIYLHYSFIKAQTIFILSLFLSLHCVLSWLPSICSFLFYLQEYNSGDSTLPKDRTLVISTAYKPAFKKEPH